MIAPMARREDVQEVALGQRIASNIQALLRARGITQGQLAAYAGLPQSSISALIIGRRNPSLLSIWKISQALRVELEELAGFKPLQIPEIPPASSENDLRQELAETRTQVAELAENMAALMERIAPVLDSQLSGGTQRQKREGQKKSA